MGSSPLDMQDATEGFTFVVKEEDAIGSVVADPSRCAAASALTHMPGVEAAEVRRTTTRIRFAADAPDVPESWRGRWVRWRNPAALKNGVEHFDRTAGLFPPGEYRLQPHGPAQTLEHQRGRKRVRDYSRPHLSRKRPAHVLR